MTPRRRGGRAWRLRPCRPTRWELAVEQPAGGLLQRAEAGERERATDGDAGDAEVGQLRHGRAARAQQHVDRQRRPRAPPWRCPRARTRPGAYTTSAPASTKRCSRATTSARSGSGSRNASARAVSTSRPLAFDGGRDALDGQVRRVAAVRPTVLDRAARERGGRRGLDGGGDARRVVGEPVLEVRGHRHGHRPRELGRVCDGRVPADLAVELPERGREAAARGGEGGEAERGEHARAADVPRVGHHQR